MGGSSRSIYIYGAVTAVTVPVLISYIIEAGNKKLPVLLRRNHRSGGHEALCRIFVYSNLRGSRRSGRKGTLSQPMGAFRSVATLASVYCVYRVSAPALHRESTDSLLCILVL